MPDPAEELPEEQLGDVDATVREILRILNSLDACVAEISALRQAVETRDIIGQAKGLLMAQAQISSDEAFESSVEPANG